MKHYLIPPRISALQKLRGSSFPLDLFMFKMTMPAHVLQNPIVIAGLKSRTLGRPQPSSGSKGASPPGITVLWRMWGLLNMVCGRRGAANTLEGRESAPRSNWSSGEKEGKIPEGKETVLLMPLWLPTASVTQVLGFFVCLFFPYVWSKYTAISCR